MRSRRMGKYAAVLLVFLAVCSLMLTGCGSETRETAAPSEEVAVAETATDTRGGEASLANGEPAESENQSDLPGSEEADAFSEDNEEYLEAEAAFFGQLQIGEEETPKLDLQQALNTMGFDPETEGMPLLESPTGSPYYVLDLSELVPVYKTPDGGLLCRLSHDVSRKILFLVDSKDEPSSVLYYCRPGWRWEEERQIYWLDGVLAEESTEEFCQKLLAIHLDSSGYERCFVLDGSEQIHWITVHFPDMKGLEYRVRFDVYPSEENRIAVHNTEGRSVWTDYSWNTD